MPLTQGRRGAEATGRAAHAGEWPEGDRGRRQLIQLA